MSRFLNFKSFFLILILFCSKAFAQSPHFKASPQFPNSGDKVKVIYDSEGSSLNGSKSVYAMVYSFINYHWKASEYPMTQEGSKFVLDYKLKDSCGIAVFKFISGDSTDGNENYVLMAHDPLKHGAMAPGGYAGWGFLRAEKYGNGIPDYFKEPKNISDTAFYYWMNNEIVANPKESTEKLAIPFAQAIYAYQGAASLPRINSELAYLKKQNTEESLLNAWGIYFTVLNNQSKADSLALLMIRLYPKGDMARLKAFRDITAKNDISLIQKKSEQFLIDFPESTADKDFDEKNFLSYDKVYESAIILASINKDYTPLNKYLNRLSFSSLINIFYKIIHIPHSRKDISDQVLLAPAKLITDRLEQIAEVIPPAYWYMSAEDWKKQYQSSMASVVLPDYINILRNNNLDKEALRYAAIAENITDYQQAGINDDYAYLLNKHHESKTLTEVLVKSIHTNQSSPEMLALLKADYIRNRKSDVGFDAYLNSLKDSKLEADSKDQIRKAMMSLEMPGWSMKGLDQKSVEFANLRGKTIVMDFWATWCVPCKASFPGMKLAQEHFSNDPNVVFYFVDTEESNKDYHSEVAEYMKANNFAFNVLFDNKIQGEKSNSEVFDRVCKAFTISGIPLKVIIDPKGKVRFLTDGYKGSPTALSDEIINMVELAKSEN